MRLTAFGERPSIAATASAPSLRMVERVFSSPVVQGLLSFGYAVPPAEGPGVAPVFVSPMAFPECLVHAKAPCHALDVEPHLSRAPVHADAQDSELRLLDEKSFGITGTRVPTAPPGTTAFSDSFACNCLHLWGHFQLLPRGRLDHGADWRLAYLSPPNVRNSPPSRR